VKTFEYEVVIEDAEGKPIRTARRTGFARPGAGEEVVINDALHVVRLVRHEQERGAKRRVYTWPRVYVRKAANALRAGE